MTEQYPHKKGICKICKKETCRLKVNICRNCFVESKKTSKEDKKTYKASWYQNNKKEIIDRQRKNSPTKEKTKQYNFKYHYGISLKDYDNFLEQQNNCCLICGRKHNENNKKLYVDHNHKTNKVRGLICFKCNTALGHFNDDIKLLKKAIDYMEKYDN